MKTMRRGGVLLALAALLAGALAAFAVLGTARTQSFAADGRTEAAAALTVDDMFRDGLHGDVSGDNALTPASGVLSAPKIVRRGEVTSVKLRMRLEGTEAAFLVLRAARVGMPWDTGGYFLQLKNGGRAVQLLLGPAVTGLTADIPLEVNLCDYATHVVEASAENLENGMVRILFAVDGKNYVDYTTQDASEVLPLEGSHLVFADMAGGVRFQLYDRDAAEPEEPVVDPLPDLTPTGEEWKTYTSKTMLKKTANWEISGGVLDQDGISVSRDQSKVLFTKTVENYMVNFDLSLQNFTDSSWVAFYLNANKADVPWNAGFHSICVFLYNDRIDIAQWAPQESIGSAGYPAGTSFDEKINVELGMFTMTHEGTDYSLVRIAINGTQVWCKVLALGAYRTPGNFGIVNFGQVSYRFSPTAEEQDSFPAEGDGTPEQRGDESGITAEIGTADWAAMTNSFNPSTGYEDGALQLYNVGAAAYGNSVAFTKLKFDLKFENSSGAIGQYALFAFGKRRQDSFLGMPNEFDFTNYGYAVKILPDGTAQFIKTNTAQGYQRLMTLEIEGGFDDNAYHTFTVYREKVADGQLKLTLFADDSATGYSVIDTDWYEQNYPIDGFLSVQNSAGGSSISVKNIRAEGSITDVAKTLEADAVNFVTYFAEDENADAHIFFTFHSASSTTKWAEIYGLDENGDYSLLLGTVYPRSEVFYLPETYRGKSVKVVSVSFASSGNKEEILLLQDIGEWYEEDPVQVERIGIKESPEGAEFIYAESGKTYIPVGANYMGLRGGDHSTFDAATSFTEADYDPLKAEAAIRALAQNGGNVLRVFLIGRTSMNPGISGDTNIPVTNEEYYFEGLYLPYMENVADFLRRARKYGVYVMLTLGDADVPQNSYYIGLQGGQSLARNKMILSAEGVTTRTKYAENVVRYFVEREPDLVKSIFSLEFQNEYALYSDQWPFNQSSGTVTLANGKTYDMAVAADREAALNESTVYYLNRMAKAVKDVDPDMLVNEGTFTLNIVGNGDAVGVPSNVTSGDYRFPVTFDVYLSSDIDFLDCHIYFAGVNNNTVDSSFADDLKDMKYSDPKTRELLKKKPIFMGEFGPGRSVSPDWEDASYRWIRTVELAKEANFRGFACWTYETHIQKECWNILSDDGKFDVFRRIGGIMTDAEEITGVSAADVTAKPGSPVTIEVKGTGEGDLVLFKTEDGLWTETAPAFWEEGTYTVEYKVLRDFVEAYEGSATVRIADEGAGTEEGGCKGCGGDGGAGLALMLALAGGGLLFKRR